MWEEERDALPHQRAHDLCESCEGEHTTCWWLTTTGQGEGANIPFRGDRQVVLTANHCSAPSHWEPDRLRWHLRCCRVTAAQFHCTCQPVKRKYGLIPLWGAQHFFWKEWHMHWHHDLQHKSKGMEVAYLSSSDKFTRLLATIFCLFLQ